MFEEMSQTRDPGDFSGKKEGHCGDKRKRPSWKSVILEVITQIRFQRIQQAVEPMLRKVVKEEVESAIRKHVIRFKRHCEEDVVPVESRSLQLKFLTALSFPVFTGTRIEGEDGSAIRVALVDYLKHEVVQYAPESSAKVEVVVLEGDFDGDNWTLEEFKNNIVRERQGKKPLLTGGVYFYLDEGIGSIGEISFTDNSSWTRSRRFRLGARLVENFVRARIREAKTGSFIVRDHRGELYKKHHPPSLSDEIWRLEKIGKDGAFHKRLRREKVNTVKDFLILFHQDRAQLRNMLGSGMSAKMWEVTVEHAQTCVLGETVYLYYSPSSQHKNGVVFNVVGQVMGFCSENLYSPIDNMSETDKTDARGMVNEAFQRWDGVISFEDLNSLLAVFPHISSSPETLIPDERNSSTLTNINSLDYAQSIPPVDIHPPFYSLECMSSSEDFSLHAVDTLDLRVDQPMNSLLYEPGIMKPFHDNEHLKFFDFDYPLQPGNPSSESFLLSSGDSIRQPAGRRWRVLSSVVRLLGVARWLTRRTDRK